jgi:Leucine-rich repeat (LRR) protein
LNFSEKNLEGSLKLKEFINLEKLNCSRNKLDSLNARNLNDLQKLDCQKNKLVSIDCSNCSRLQILDCKKNKLTKLNLTNCSNIAEFHCAENNLTGLEFLQGLFNEKLEIINLANNSINDLSYFKKFIDLRQVYLDNNKFAGSLEPLKYLDKLEELDISNTDIDSGLEYLPESIQYFNCSAYQPERKVKVVEEELALYKLGEGKYDFPK